MAGTSNVHSALVIVSNESDSSPQGRTSWQSFLASIGPAISKAKGTKALTENVWLIPMQDDALVFAEILRDAAMMRFPYKVHFFLEAPTWIESPENRA